MDLDQELLQRCLAGENSAWESLLQGYARKIYNFCYRFTGRAEEADDLTQEVFIKVFQTLQSFDAAQGLIFDLAAPRGAESPGGPLPPHKEGPDNRIDRRGLGDVCGKTQPRAADRRARWRLGSRRSNCRGH